MAEENEVVTTLSDSESLELLSSKSFGRLVVRRKDDMDLFPLNYIVHEGAIYFRTAEGSKLFTLTLNDDVLFEADHVDHDHQHAWSVIIKGSAHTVDSNEECSKLDELDLKPWLPTRKYNYVKVEPKHISGRKFNLGEEPERYF